MKKFSGIYCIKNLINGKRYIGQGQDVYTRMNASHNYSSALLNSIEKHGKENFKKYILIYCELWELDRLEKEYIKLFNSHVTQNGYNISYGGKTPRRGLKHSKNTKKLIGAAQLGSKNHSFGKKRENTTSRYYGVYKRIDRRWSQEYTYWEVRISKKYIGHYKTELESAKAYDKYITENKLPNPLNF